MGRIFAEGDKACQGRDKSSDAAYIYSDQKRTPVCGKLGQEDSGGDVTYYLAGENACEQCVLFQKKGEELANGFYSCNVSCKEKESCKGEEQGIVYLCQRLAVGKKDCHQNNGQADVIGYYSEHREDGERKENQIKDGAALWEAFVFVMLQGQSLFGNKKATESEEDDGEGEGNEHNAHKIQSGDIEFSIDIKILGIAKGGQHTAEICGDVLEDEYGRHVFFFACCIERNVSQGQKGQECHIVC